MPFLKVFTHGEERTVFLGDDPIVFGRGEEADVMLRDVKVSRQHCVIEKDPNGRWRVLDLQSGNGTRVNGAPIRSHDLSPEDVIEVGDAKVLFAAEAAAVVVGRPGGAAPPPSRAEPEAPDERPASERPRRARSAGSSRSGILIASVAVVGLVALGLLWQSGDGKKPKEPESIAGGAGPAGGPDGAPGVARVTARDIEASLPEGLDPAARVAALEKRLQAATPAEQEAIREAMRRAQDEIDAKRERFFKDLEQVFEKHVEEGQFARAREIWFFLSGDADWTPLPPTYRDRIIRAMTELENRASIARTKLLDDVSRAQDARQYDEAEELVRDALPRFGGTSVERSLQERLAEIEHARRRPVDVGPRAAPTQVRADTRKRMDELLARLPQREFDAVAKGLRELAASVADARARAELEHRAQEAAAAAELQAGLVADLAAGKVPASQIANRWRVLQGDAAGLTVRTKGNEVTWPWKEVPPRLHLALLAKQAGPAPDLGLAVAAHAIGGDAERIEALALVYADEKPHPAVDRYLAEAVRNEPVPEGGYVVFEGELLARAEFVRKREEALIAQYRAQLDKTYEAIRADRALNKLDKLVAKKEELDKRRAYALELIFDEQKYFYPYRDRANEYYPVQKEVDHRVAAVQELWDDAAQVKVAPSDAMSRNLKSFDEAAAELAKRFVDIEEKVSEITFLRSYFGQKFTIRSLYRTPEERELLDYSAEVMVWNTGVEGDITKIEREQVRVTNEYRMMFGRWPVRIVEKLVLSSRGHCEEMSRLGYFGHFSSTPGRRTPYDRMRLAGYEYGASENCVMGTSDPKSAHERWCHSSGHHRNLLTEAWTEMGTGHYGSLMTQNFGRAPMWRKDQAGANGGDVADPEPPADEDPPADGEDPYDYEDED